MDVSEVPQMHIILHGPVRAANLSPCKVTHESAHILPISHPEVGTIREMTIFILGRRKAP
ncbi:hypothetical protein HGRIS_010716 [Hohenbuehelia grisea]|uniref:Uncharacterized protein n=1 Tax=Hohenbuehelia grisea TaxID=104357 RepID=A0ABR3IXX4_9AGAR